MARPTIQLKLVVLPNNTIVVPGCEPTSAVSSLTLLQSRLCHGNVLVALDDALNAIPGSSITAFDNPGGPLGQKYFVLPPISTDCPCAPVIDYYAILRSIAQEVPAEEPSLDYCDIIDKSFCLAPDLAPERPSDSYFPEGNALGLTLHKSV